MRRIVLAATIAIAIFAALSLTRSLLIAVVGATLGFVIVSVLPIFQSYIINEQLRVARRQEDRERARDEQAAAHAEIQLQLWQNSPGPNPLALATPTSVSDDSAELRLEVFLHNSGVTENANACHLEILIPLIVTPLAFTGTDIRNFIMDPLERESIRYLRLSANCLTKVQPGTTVPVGTISMVGTRGSIPTPVKTDFLWRVTNGPYVLPARDTYGRILVGLMFPDASKKRSIINMPSQVPLRRADNTEENARVASEFVRSIGFGLDPEKLQKPRPFAAQLIVPSPLKNRIDPSLFEDSLQNRLRLIETAQDVANGTDGFPRYYEYFQVTLHDELFRENFIEHYEFASHEEQVAYLWGVRIYMNGAIVRRSAIWTGDGSLDLNWYKREVAATIVFARHAWKHYGIQNVDTVELSSVLRGAEDRKLRISGDLGSRFLPAGDLDHLTLMPSPPSYLQIAMNEEFGKDAEAIAERFARVLRSKYSVAPPAS